MLANVTTEIDIDYYLQQLAIPKHGSAVERVKAVTAMRRVLNYLKPKCADEKFILEVNKLHFNGDKFVGIATGDEIIDCLTEGDMVAYSVIIRDEKNAPVRSTVFKLSKDLGEYMFGKESFVSVLGVVEPDTSILSEAKIKELTTETKKVESEEKEEAEAKAATSPEATETTDTDEAGEADKTQPTAPVTKSAPTTQSSKVTTGTKVK